jgi:hypothetical protein
MALAVVQSKFVNIGSGSGPFQITFTSSLTTGNKCYLFVMGAYFNGGFTAGWTIESTNGPGSSSATQYMISRTVQGGDGTTPPAFLTSTNAAFRIIGIEISGGASIEAIVQNVSTGAPVAGPTTTHNNDLGLLASGANGGFGSYTPSAGWTNDQYDTGGSTILDHIAVPSSGTSLTASPSNTVGGTTGHWMSVALFVNTVVLGSLTGVSATAAARNVTTRSSASPTLVHATSTATAHAVAAGHAVNLTHATATGTARGLTSRSGAAPLLVGARAIALASPVHGVGQSASKSETHTWGTYR